MKKRMVLRTFTTRLEAEIVKGFLESNDIAAFVTADDEGGAYPFPFQPSSTGVQLFVEDKNEEKAKKLLEKN